MEVKLETPPGAGPLWGINESWTQAREIGHWYDAAADFATERLKGRGKLLVIGSPIYEAMELEANGWDVTYLDIRRPPIDIKWIPADAAEMPVLNESFDAISSTCVLCHVGLGRYGDVEREHGDEQMLREMYRILKPGGKVAVCFGPCSFILNQTIRLGISHRIYCVESAVGIAKSVGFKVQEMKIWDVVLKAWKADDNPNLLDSHYLMALLSKDQE